jgi:ATP-dependent Clp protease adaptor protein ClpS
MQSGNDTSVINDVDTTTLLGKPHKVILFDDSVHTMEEVSIQIIKAIRCPPEKAINIMIEAHSTGQAVVFTGSLERCELVVEILEQIKLTTDIIPA